MTSIGRFAVTFTISLALLGCGSNPPEPPPSPQPPPVRIHPVFHTWVTSNSNRRPAIQVDIKDDWELFGRAELYLTVQSSRFPADTWIILPLNIGEFAGCRTRFVQLPFEIESKEVLLFNVLDEDGLTDAEQNLILNACQAGGYCIQAAGMIYQPDMTSIISPAIGVGAEILGEAIIKDFKIHNFQNLGTAEYITQLHLPGYPNEANELTLLDSQTLTARVVIKLFGPDSPIEFPITAR